MKTAIYIEDGTIQLVVTPENKFEKNALSTMQDKILEAKIFAGSFYDCRGGWVRQSDYNPQLGYAMGMLNKEDKSLIVRVDEKSK